MSLGPCGASDGGARTEQCRLVPRKMGIWPTAEQGVFRLCFAEGSCGVDVKHWFKRCSVWADSAQLMERALSKDCSLFKPSPSMTDGSDGKWKAPQMILDRFLIFFS